MWNSLLSAFSGSSSSRSSGSGSGNFMYSGENKSSISTPITTTQGGIGAQSFNIGGNPNLAQVTQNKFLIAAAVVAALGVAFIMTRSRR